MQDYGLFEIMFNLRAMRRLKNDPIPQDLLERVLEAATQAPSAQSSERVDEPKASSDKMQ